MSRLSMVALRVLESRECCSADHLPGLFVTVEGIEGAGKSTLAAELARWFERRSCDVVLTQEPGGDAVAEEIRKIVLDSRSSITDRAELLLFEAARAQHVDKVIVPALRRGAVVISDRFGDSSVAYQAAARGIGVETVTALNDFATCCLRPDITLLLDVSPDAGLARELGPDRMSSESRDFHEKVRQAYLDLAQRESERFVVIDAALSAEEVLAQAVRAVERCLQSLPCDNTPDKG